MREGADGYWYAAATHDDKTRSFNDSVLIKGTVDYYDNTGMVNVTYGIEENFVSEGTGKNIDWRDDMAARVTVDRFGRAVARDLLANGKPPTLISYHVGAATP